MAKAIIFELKVQGTDTAIRTQKELTDQIKATNDALKQAELGSEAYRQLEAELGKLKLAQKDVSDSARLVQRDLEAQAGASARTYKSLNAELVNARALFRELTETERKGQIGQDLVNRIKELDTELKGLDAQIGNFQRNVGNYPTTVAVAFAPIKNMLNTSIPGFQQLDSAAALFRDGIGQVGQAASAAGKIITASFIGFQVISLIMEGVNAIREFSAETNKLRGEIGKLGNETPEQVNRATAGIQAISATFKKETDETLQAANALAKNFGVTFEEATAFIEKGFLAGADASGKYLDVLTEMAPKAKGAGASLDEFGVALVEAGRAGLQEEEAIEKVVIQSSKFTGTVDGMIQKTDELTAKQIEQLDAEKELAAAKVELSQKVADLTAGTSTLRQTVETYVYKGLVLVLDYVKFITAGFVGMGEVGKAVWSKIVNATLSAGNELGIVYLKLKQLNPFNSDDDQIGQQIQALEARRGQYQQAGEGLADAFMRGFNSVYQAKGVVDQNNAPNNRAAGIAQGLTASEIAAARQKAVDEANKAERKYYDERLALLNELNKRLVDAGLAAIQDQTAAEIAAEKQRFADVQAELLAQSRAQEAAQLEARAALVKTYGESSQKLADFDRQLLADNAARRALAQQIEQQELVVHLRRIEAIKQDAARRDAAAQLERIKTSLEASVQGYTLQANAAAIGLEKAITQALQSNLPESEKGAIVLQLRLQADQAQNRNEAAKLDEQIAIIQKRLDQIANDDTLTSASISEYDFLNNQLDAYALKRAQLERQYTELVQAEALKRQQAKTKELETGLQNAQQAAQILDTIGRAAFENDLGRIEEKERANQDSISRIEKALQTATGQQKVQLEKQLAQEKQKEEALAAQKERLQREEAQRAKAFAVIQSLIATALAVVRALATPPAPNVGAAFLAGALGAAQTAVIAAQPAAEGALIGSVPEQGNGLIVTAQNIPQLRNGDNVLATLKRGEVVLNRRQQAMLGGAPTFRALRVPGFAEGGIAGAVLGAPDLSGITNAERVKALEANQALLTDYVRATNGRIDRIKTYVVSSDVRDDLGEGAAIKTIATLG